MQVNIFYKSPMPKYYRASGKYKAVVLRALGRAAAKDGEVNVILACGRAIQGINKKFLGHDYVTDVISFNHPAAPGKDAPFGDIFICFPQAKKQAAGEGHGALKELLILAAHGALHLVGHKDDTVKLRADMNEKARRIAEEVL